jgi:hypothetical protein
MARGPYYPVGRYVGRVVRQELGSSAKKGTPQFAVTFQIIDALDQFGTSVGVHEQYERTVYIYFSKNQQAMEISAEALKTLGYHGSRISELADVDFTGNECELYCKHEEYEGEPRERWSINTPRAPRESKPVDKSELRKLDALFGKAVKSSGTKPEAQPDSDLNRAMQEAAAADDDSPF